MDSSEPKIEKAKDLLRADFTRFAVLYLLMDLFEREKAGDIGGGFRHLNATWRASNLEERIADAVPGLTGGEAQDAISDVLSEVQQYVRI